MRIKPDEIPSLIKESISRWSEDRAPSMGAALSYYTVFSLAPLLLIVIGIAGLVFGEEAARGAIIEQLQGLLGDEGARAINELVDNAGQTGTGIVATIVGVVTLLFGASGVFVELQDDLDRIWKAPPRVGAGIINFVRARLLTFGMVLAQSPSCSWSPLLCMRRLLHSESTGEAYSRRRNGCFSSSTSSYLLASLQFYLR